MYSLAPGSVGRSSPTLRSLMFGALLLAASPAVHADYVASAQEEAAWRAKLKKGVPPVVGDVMKMYPGAKLDIECSVQAMSGDDTYVFRVGAPLADVQRHFKDNPPDETVGSAYPSREWCASDSGTTDIILRTWDAKKSARLKAEAQAKRDAIARFAASPPAPEMLGVPLPAGASFDPECTYEADVRRAGPVYDGPFQAAYCYRVPVETYSAATRLLEDLGIKPEKLDNNVRVEPFTNQPPIRIVYWIKPGGPTQPLAEWQAAHAQRKSPASAATAQAASASTPAASTPSAQSPAAQPAKANPAEAAREAVNKLKGLFGR